MPSDAQAPQPRRKIRLHEFYYDRERQKHRCAKTTALKWIREGRLQAYRLGRMTFVDETFDEFIERQATARDSAA